CLARHGAGSSSQRAFQGAPLRCRARPGGSALRASHHSTFHRAPVKSRTLMPARTAIVVPCFNEAARLRPEGFRPLLDDPDTELVLVDDGSTDATRARLAEVAARWPSASVLGLDENGGKGEAVRRGMRAGLERGAELVGYLDADLAT